MLSCKREKFHLDRDQIYLNGAYMSPLLRTAEVAGMIGMRKKRHPTDITTTDFFGNLEIARELFARLINVPDPYQCVVIPSTSYAIASAVQNIQLSKGQNIIIIDQIFPSNYYGWEIKVKEVGAEIRVIKAGAHSNTVSWSQRVLDAIDYSTRVVNISHVHWADGTTYDLKAIAEKVHRYGGYLLLDGTQSIGAYPIDVADIGADVVFAGSYKWMLGPYSIGMAYFNERFQNGRPLEESWLNRVHSDDFANLIDYQDQYRVGSRRYEVGEAPNFILLPMMIAGMQQLLEWTPHHIQSYCRSIASDSMELLRSAGYEIASEGVAYHLWGVRVPPSIDIERIKNTIIKENISVSYRADAIRVSPSIYNDKDEVDAFAQVLLSLT